MGANQSLAIRTIVRSVIPFTLLLAFLSYDAWATADCSNRIEKQFAPELSGHVDKLLPCRFHVLYSLDGDGQATITSIQASETRCNTLDRQIRDAFGRFVFSTGRPIESCRHTITLLLNDS